MSIARFSRIDSTCQRLRVQARLSLGLVIAGGLLAVVSGPAPGADDEEEEPTTIVLRVVPARPPYRALSEHLLPTQIELTPGDAAPLNLKACLMMSEEGLPTREKTEDDVDKWLRTPIAEMPKDEARKFLSHFRSVLDLLKIAARRDRCDWDLALREENIIHLSMPEAPTLRWIGTLVALDARLKFADGDRAGGIDSLRTGFALARQVSIGSTIVGSLAGVSIAERQLNVLRESLQSDPDNFYWDLATLPTPLIDMRLGLEYERDGAYSVLPALRDVATAERTPAQWQADWEQLLESRELKEILSDIVPEVRLPRNGGAATTAAMLARAKAILAAEGWSPERIAGCCDAQCLIVGCALGYEHYRDEVSKATGQWMSDAARHKLATDSYIATAKEREVIPIAYQMIPWVRVALLAAERPQRTVAALATLEALRFYAADHDGRLPAALAEIKALPIPDDPITGAPFNYVLAEGVATLSAPPPDGYADNPAFSLRWQIQMAK